MAASALVLPIQPLMVSAVHTGMMEVFLHLFPNRRLCRLLLLGVHVWYQFLLNWLLIFMFFRLHLQNEPLMIQNSRWHTMYIRCHHYQASHYSWQMMLSLRLHSFMLVGILLQLLVLAPVTSFQSSSWSSYYPICRKVLGCKSLIAF